GIKHGLIHVQFICSDAGYWLIEVTRRCPGDLYSLLIEMTTGYPYAESYVATFLGGQRAPRIQAKAKNYVVRQTIISQISTKLLGYSFNQTTKIRLFLPLKVCGDTLENSPKGRAGIMFFEEPNKKSQDQLYSSIMTGSLYELT